MKSTDIYFIDCYNLADGLQHKMETYTKNLKIKCLFHSFVVIGGWVARQLIQEGSPGINQSNQCRGCWPSRKRIGHALSGLAWGIQRCPKSWKDYIISSVRSGPTLVFLSSRRLLTSEHHDQITPFLKKRPAAPLWAEMMERFALSVKLRSGTLRTSAACRHHLVLSVMIQIL